MADPTKTISIYVKETRSGKVIAENQDLLLETSSTIKIPIIYLALQKSLHDNIPLSRLFTIKPHHRSNGSGIINWTNCKQLSLADLIAAITTYSDCVATNVLIEFVGGKKHINAFLEQQGLAARLLMTPIHFPEEDNAMPRVGIATTYDMYKLFTLLIGSDWPSEYKHFIYEKLAHVDTSWFQEALPKSLDIQLWHKTGSMINVGKNGDTVFNATGLIEYQNRVCYFALMSRAQFAQPATDRQLQDLKTNLVNQVVSKLKLCSMQLGNDLANSSEGLVGNTS